MKSYRFVSGEHEFITEIKRSKFIAAIKGELDGDGAEKFVKSVRKKYPDATHNCYAYISDIHGNAARFSDDGEPSGTAGMPMLEVLKKRGLVRTTVVVTRYFGGIKLGAGGLVSAYTDAVANAVDNAPIAEKGLCKELIIKASYPQFAIIEKLIRRGGAVMGNTDFADDVKASLWIEEDRADQLASELTAATSGNVTIEYGTTDYVILSAD